MALSNETGRPPRIASSVGRRSSGTRFAPTSATRALTNLATSDTVRISRSPQVRGLREKWMPSMSSDSPLNLPNSNIPTPFVMLCSPLYGQSRMFALCDRLQLLQQRSPFVDGDLFVRRFAQSSGLVGQLIGHAERAASVMMEHGPIVRLLLPSGRLIIAHHRRPSRLLTDPCVPAIIGGGFRFFASGNASLGAEAGLFRSALWCGGFARAQDGSWRSKGMGSLAVLRVTGSAASQKKSRAWPR